MTPRNSLPGVRGALLEGERFLITSHRNPDGDAVGSCLALAAGLSELGKSCVIASGDGVPMNLAWLPLAEQVQPAANADHGCDTVVLLDCGAIDRTGLSPEALHAGRTLVNIDHHPGNPLFGTANWVDPGACATAELVYQVLQSLPTPIGYSAATAIYTGILTDTGCFRFSNTSARAFQIAAEMLAKGVDPSWVAQMVFDQQPIGRLRLLSLVLETLELSPRDKAAAALVTREMFHRTHTGVEGVEGFVNHTRSLCGVEVGLLLREEAPGRYRVALRSKGRVDVSAIARIYGGGGHHNAAGATLDGAPDTLRRELFAHVEEALDRELLGQRKAG
ncbi:MAG TPA: bifunctional oligoribonuclease/PAP phosphatase NrnA [Deferrisomatales bacterium]|nr:bifunctional oligoribonuclease/PAP phosphatase NrnA [Deferrisomatales bacterium]